MRKLGIASVILGLMVLSPAAYAIDAATTATQQKHSALNATAKRKRAARDKTDDLGVTNGPSHFDHVPYRSTPCIDASACKQDRNPDQPQSSKPKTNAEHYDDTDEMPEMDLPFVPNLNN